MAFKVRGDRQVGHCLTASRLAEIRSAAESLLLSSEKNGAGAVADALIKAAETLPYNVRAQLAVDLSKACISKGKHTLFESVLDALLSQDPLSADEAVDDLDFALEQAEDDDTFVDVKAGSRSNMHARHTHHHLGLTMAIFSSSVKDRCLRALHDSNTLMYPKAASLLCSCHRSSPITPDTEIIALASNPRSIPRLVCILIAACMKHKRTPVCDALASHFWSSHHRDRCAALLPACSLSFVRNFVREHPQVATQSQFIFDRFLRAHAETSMDLLEAKLKSCAPLLRDAVWIHGPFHKTQSGLWFQPLLRHNPSAHIRLASLIRSYPALCFSSVPQAADIKTSFAFGVVSPMFPIFGAFKSHILDLCKVKGKSNEFWSEWFPILLDTIPTQCSPVLKRMTEFSAFDIEETREACKASLLKLLDPEDQQNCVLVECFLRSHTSSEVLSLQQLDAQTFRDAVSVAKQICAHPGMSRAVYRDYGSIFELQLNQEQYGAVFERILSVAEGTESQSSKQHMDIIANLSLVKLFNKAFGNARQFILYGVASWPLALFVPLHRFSINSLARIAAPAAVEPLSPQRSLDAIANSWKEASKELLSCFLERALSHGESSLTIDGSILPNAVFFSQQLEAWGMLQDEFQTKFIAAAAAMAKHHPSLKWNQQSIDSLWSLFKKEILSHLVSRSWSPDITSGKTFGFPVFIELENGTETTPRYCIHPSVLQALVNYVLKTSASIAPQNLDLSLQNSNFDILAALLVRCFHSQVLCLVSAHPTAKQLFESLDSVIAQLGQCAHQQLSSNFQGDQFVTAAIKFIQLHFSNLIHFDNYSQYFSLITFFRPILRQLPPFFSARLNAGAGAISTVLRKICGIFQQGSFYFGTGYVQRQWLCAKGFFEFFGKTIEQHAMEGLEFLFEGCKSCIVQSSSKGDLYQLSINIFSTLSYRLRPSDTIYPAVIEFVQENLKAFCLVKQELVLCEHLPGEALNEIAWDFATNPKLPESVREQALSRLDLNDPSKKQEILQNKCRARTFELRSLGFQILLQASVRTCHLQWGTNFVSAVQETYAKTANESAENLNSIHALLYSNLQALQQSLETKFAANPSPLCILSPANSSDFQAVFKKIACSNTSSQVSDDDGENEDGSECDGDGRGGASSNMHSLREALVKFALFSAGAMMRVLPEQDFRLPVQNWISFAMAVKYAQEAQGSECAPCEIARNFVLVYKQPSTNVAAHSSVPVAVQIEEQKKSTQFVIACLIRCYEELGALYPNPESETVQLAPQRDLSCLSLKRLVSLMALCKPEVWMHTDIVSCLLLHWRDLDMDSIRKGAASLLCIDDDSEGDIMLFYSSLMSKWFQTTAFKNAHEAAHSGCDSMSAIVRSARFTPIQQLDCMTADLRSLTQMFLDTFIRSDRAACLLPHWLAFYSTGTIVYDSSKMSTLFRRPTALPHVEMLLKLCPSTAYISFVNRFMMRFAQHLIPSQFLHPEPLRREHTINGIFVPVTPKPGNKKAAVARGTRAVRGGGRGGAGRSSDAPKTAAAPTTILSVWMHGLRLHSCQTSRLKHQLLNTFSDSSFGNPQRLKALRRATRLPSLSVYDILKTIQPEFVSPPLQVSVVSGFVSASLDFENASTLSVITIWTSKDSMSLYPDAVDLHMAGGGQKQVSAGSYKCFVPLKVATDPSVTCIGFPAGSTPSDAIDTVVAAQIGSGRLSDLDLCVAIERTFDSSKSWYELCFSWSTKPTRPSDARENVIQALFDQLKQELKVGSNAVTQQKRRVPLQSTSSAGSKAAVYRRVTFPMTETSEKLVRECFDDNPVNLFPLLASELSKAAIVACGYCKESTACLDTLYSPRFLASDLSSAAVMLFERSSAVFPSGSSVSFAEKLLFRNTVFFPPKVTIQKSIVRVLTANIDESNSDIIMKVFRCCRHVSVLALLIGTCLRLIRTPTKVDLGKTLLLETSKIAVKAEGPTIAAFSKFCEVSFLTIRSFLEEETKWNTPTRNELTQEWGDAAEVEVDLDFLPWYMDNIIIPMSRECTNPDLRDFCIMARFCSDEAFKSTKNCIKNPDSKKTSHSIYTVDRALIEIEAARATYLQCTMHHLPAALSLDNLDTFHRVGTVASAAADFIDNMIDSGVAAIQIQCMRAYASWIVELLPYINHGTEMRFPICRTEKLHYLVHCVLSCLGHGTDSTKIDLSSHAALQNAAMELCDAAVQVPGLDSETRSRLLFSKWKIATGSKLDQFPSVTTVWKESILAQASSNPSQLPHQAKAFEKYVSFYLKQPQLWDCAAPAKDCPFACAVKLLLQESGHVFVSVSQHEELVSHAQTLVADAFKRFCNFHLEPSLSESKVGRFQEMFIALQPDITDCAKAIFDSFQFRIASCSTSNLQDAAAFQSALSFFQTILPITKPEAIPKSPQLSKILLDKLQAMAAVQTQIHTSLSQWALQMLQAYTAKYCDTLAQGDAESELPPWFVPVKQLCSILEAAVQTARTSGASNATSGPKWVPNHNSNSPSDLFCLRVYLRLLSSDPAFASPSIIIEQINSLCRSNLLFANEGEVSTLFVPETHTDRIFSVIETVAARYCNRDRQVLISGIKATHDCLKELNQSVLQLASAIKSSKSLQRRQMESDCQFLLSSMQRACRLVKAVFVHSQNAAASQNQRQFFREEIAVHASNLCDLAVAVISAVELHGNQLNMVLETIVAELAFFLKLPVSVSQVGGPKIFYDDFKNRREFCSLVLSGIPLHDMRLDTFQESWFMARFRMQDSLLGSKDHYMKFVVQLQRLECIVRASESMVLSHGGDSDAMRDPTKLPAIMATIPPIFLAQFKLLWTGLFDAYDKFTREQFELAKRDKVELPAQALSDFTAFLASFQVGSVCAWLEKVTGITPPAQFIVPSGDMRLRPMLLAHYFRALLISATTHTFGLLQPVQLLPLCAPVSALSSASEIIELLRALFKQHALANATKGNSIEGLASFFKALWPFFLLLDASLPPPITHDSSSFTLHPSPSPFTLHPSPMETVLLDAQLLICADFVGLNPNPVFVSALRTIIQNENIPSMPVTKPQPSAAPILPPLGPTAPPPPPPPLREAPLSAKEQAQMQAHAFGSLLLPLVKQAYESGGVFNHSLRTLFSAIHFAVSR